MKSLAHSAVTIINAMANGKGGAIGIDLKVTADVKIIDEGINGDIHIRGREYSDFTLVEHVKDVIEKEFDIEFGINIDIDSEIPIGKGLKSSSAVSNALTKAIVESLNIDLKDKEIINLGIKASKKAGVTITGAYDDASASYYGGVCLTDNSCNEILKRESIEEKPVILLLPEKTVLTSSLKNKNFENIKPFIDVIFETALDGNWREASFLNGIVYSLFFRYDPKLMQEVLEWSEVVGLSGKGPAFYSITNNPEKVRDIWTPFGEILEAKTR